MKRLYLYLTFITVIAVLCVGLLFGYSKYYHIVQALDWCNLSGLPDSAYNVQVSRPGGLTYSEYDITFNASKSDILNWMKSSPGIQTAVYAPPSAVVKRINIDSNGPIFINPHSNYKYIISPRKGIAWAEVNISIDYSIVNIRTYGN